MAPKDRPEQLTESPDELAEVIARARRVSEDLAWLYERTATFSQPAWRTGWTAPIAQLLPFSQLFHDWAVKLNKLSQGA
jgi:hypothetical protein